MCAAIEVITTPFFLNTTVNCFLVRAGDGFVLIDTGRFSKRAVIEGQLADAGCQPGNLKLIVLTHGDFDHCGNAAYLRKQYGAKVAMHVDDTGMVERGDMFWNRKQPNPLIKGLFGSVFRLSEADRFKPDWYLKAGDTLAAYGLDAEVIELPGHSKGNVGILTRSGDLFCGDLLGNVGKPDVWTMIDDPVAAKASVEKLRRYTIQTVYPGHGKPFAIETFLNHYQPK